LTTGFFVSDLHGSTGQFEMLFQVIAAERPRAVFLGGDLLPSRLSTLRSLNFSHHDFINQYLVEKFTRLCHKIRGACPRIFLILGNDDGRFEEAAIIDAATRGVWEYIHARKVSFGSFQVYGYSYIPPSPFLLKDWERYDVSRYVDPGCVSPEEARLSVSVSEHERKHSTIKDNLDQPVREDNPEHTVFYYNL